MESSRSRGVFGVMIAEMLWVKRPIDGSRQCPQPDSTVVASVLGRFGCSRELQSSNSQTRWQDKVIVGTEQTAYRCWTHGWYRRDEIEDIRAQAGGGSRGSSPRLYILHSGTRSLSINYSNDRLAQWIIAPPSTLCWSKCLAYFA
ncbi:hypothetical protein KC365_g109 [Hortaea werneckii]|nr:hypothetical protein KC339_g103 [Hortaea werneckii]KAI7245870.1 hypothetical protein KC365_g109 [Hortaea werneckii]